MSHIVGIKMCILDIECLGESAKAINPDLEVVRQSTYNWYGRSVGGQIPAGFTASDLGKCDFAIRIKPGSKTFNACRAKYGGSPYEIGVVRRRDGKAGYMLMWDYWQGGYGMQEIVGGEQCQKLTQEYTLQVNEKEARPLVAQGWLCVREVQKNGQIDVCVISPDHDAEELKLGIQM